MQKYDNAPAADGVLVYRPADRIAAGGNGEDRAVDRIGARKRRCTELSESERVSEGCPRVTVGVPVFNGESFLAETLDSLLNQTFSDFEIVISDNASTDRTEEICRAYAARDPRIRYYRSDANRGAAWNHNRVFELARGEYFKWNSADDLCAPEFLARCVAALDEDASAIMVCSNVLVSDDYGEAVRTEASSRLKWRRRPQ